MKSFLFSFLAKPASPVQKVTVWAAGISVVVGLGTLRTATDAEYAFASLVIIPVVAVAWIGGTKGGLVFSVLAAAMWISTDLVMQRQFSAPWIPYLNGLTRLATYGFVAYLTGRVRALMTLTQDMASHDGLTGLLNRRAFFDAGEEEVMRSRRYAHPLTVVFLDLDDFKQLNDSQGHKAGDNALMAVAIALKRQLRATDRIARLGGDEFAVLLPEISYQAATETGNKLAGAVNAALTVFPPASVSVGIAWFESATHGFPAMLEAADALMYQIKQSGKRGVRTRRVPAVAPTQEPVDPR